MRRDLVRDQKTGKWRVRRRPDGGTYGFPLTKKDKKKISDRDRKRTQKIKWGWADD